MDGNRYRRVRAVSLFVLLLILFGPSAGSVPDSSGAEQDWQYAESQAMQRYSLIHDGLERTFFVHRPKGYTGARAWPVVLAFHGGGGDPASLERQSSLNEKADAAGFIVVYPEGTGPVVLGRRIGTFNAGGCCGYAERHQVDDIGFTSKIIDLLKKKYFIDTRRIYATGHSNGALMAYRLACELTDKIAAVAANAAQDPHVALQPSRPISILHFHGTADPAAHYWGGHCGGGTVGDEGWDCRSVPDYLAAWAASDGCTGKPTTTYRKGSATCVTYVRCKDGAQVTLCTIEGSGHTWPGGHYEKDSASWQKRVGKISYDISATDMLWDFFVAHPGK